MTENSGKENSAPLEPEELENQSAELLPDREVMTVLDGPLRGPVPLDVASPDLEDPSV
jgi:hypothetical protein